MIGRCRLIISRTPGEYSAMNPYAASKAAAWQFCRMYARTQGWPIVGAALFQVYGPGQPVPTAASLGHHIRPKWSRFPHDGRRAGTGLDIYI